MHLRTSTHGLLMFVAVASVSEGGVCTYHRTYWSPEDHEHKTETFTESYYDVLQADQSPCFIISSDKAPERIQAPHNPVIFDQGRLTYKGTEFIYDRYNEGNVQIKRVRVPLDGWHCLIDQCLHASDSKVIRQKLGIPS